MHETSDPHPGTTQVLTPWALWLGGAFTAWGFWLIEIFWVRGWMSLAWIYEFNWSMLPICALIALVSYQLIAPQAPWTRRLAFVLVGTAVMIAAFAMARSRFHELFGSSHLPPYFGPKEGISILTRFLIATLMAPFGLSLLAHRWITPIRWRVTVPLMTAGLMASLPLSYLTQMTFPSSRGSLDFVHAIKMGYPVLWNALFIPAALFLGSRATR